jgi:hypothetical protein
MESVFDIIRHYVENFLPDAFREEARKVLDAADPKGNGGEASKEGDGSNAEA